MDKLRITGSNQKKIWSLLDRLETKDEVVTFPHSIRVGLLGYEVSKALGLDDPKILFYAGLLHDVGKLGIEKPLLGKPDKFTDEDHNHMKEHVIIGYNILRKVYPFSAEVLLWHHFFQKENSYPSREQMDRLQHTLRLDQRKKAEQNGLYLALQDCYDSLTTRADNGVPPINPSESESVLVSRYPDYKEIINLLYVKKVFGVEYKKLFSFG